VGVVAQHDVIKKNQTEESQQDPLGQHVHNDESYQLLTKRPSYYHKKSLPSVWKAGFFHDNIKRGYLFSFAFLGGGFGVALLDAEFGSIGFIRLLSRLLYLFSLFRIVLM